MNAPSQFDYYSILRDRQKFKLENNLPEILNSNFDRNQNFLIKSNSYDPFNNNVGFNNFNFGDVSISSDYGNKGNSNSKLKNFALNIAKYAGQMGLNNYIAGSLMSLPYVGVPLSFAAPVFTEAALNSLSSLKDATLSGISNAKNYFSNFIGKKRIRN